MVVKKPISEYFKERKGIRIAFIVVNILIMGFLMGALSGDTDNLDETTKLALLIPLSLIPVFIVVSGVSGGKIVTYIRSFLILCFTVFGLVELILTKPDVDLKAQILGYLALIFMGINWIFLNHQMCSMCK